MFPPVIDNTMRKSFLCPTRFRRAHIDHLHPVADVAWDPLAGRAFASGIEATRLAYYGEGASIRDAIMRGRTACLEAFAAHTCPPGTSKTPANMIAAIAYYFNVWPLDATDALLPYRDATGVPSVEVTFDFHLPIPHPDTGVPIRYAGRFDMLAQGAGGRTYVVDEKTAGKLGDTWMYQWDLDAGLCGYVYGAMHHCDHYPLLDRENILAVVRGVSILKSGFGHAEVTLNKPRWMVARWAEQLYRDVTRMVQAYEGGLWDMDLANRCTEYGRRCAFMPLCMAKNPERLIEGNYRERIWNPLQRLD